MQGSEEEDEAARDLVLHPKRGAILWWPRWKFMMRSSLFSLALTRSLPAADPTDFDVAEPVLPLEFLLGNPAMKGFNGMVAATLKLVGAKAAEGACGLLGRSRTGRHDDVPRSTHGQGLGCNFYFLWSFLLRS